MVALLHNYVAQRLQTLQTQISIAYARMRRHKINCCGFHIPFFQAGSFDLLHADLFHDGQSESIRAQLFKASLA